MDSAKHFKDGRPAIVLSAHGSAMEEANLGLRELARRIQQAASYAYVRASSFLGPCQPELSPAITEAVGADFHRTAVIPYSLTLGTHLRPDLPTLVAGEQQKCPHVDMQVGRSLEDHPDMVSLVLSRIREATKEVTVSQ